MNRGRAIGPVRPSSIHRSAAMTESAIFTAAVKLPARDRAAYLDEACRGNREQRLEVEELLRHHDPAGDFLEYPAVAPHGAADLAATGPDTPPDTETSPAKEIGTVVGGRYRLLELLGEGG